MLKKGFLIFALSLIASGLISSEYDQIKDPLPFDPHGWFTQDNADHLERIIAKKNVKTIIEIGSWLGCSTRFMAERLPEGGILYAIDTWEGSIEHQAGEFSKKLPTLYSQFLSNVIHAGLQAKIEPIRAPSLAAEASLHVKADLIFIDAGHDTESVYKDIISWYPHLNENGVICGDDWRWPTVRLAVKQAAKQLGLAIGYADTFWYLKPKDASLNSDLKLNYLNMKGAAKRVVRSWIGR